VTKAELLKALEPYPDDTTVFVRLEEVDPDCALWDVAEVESDWMLDGTQRKVAVMVGA